jgi:hypothetical protein
MRWREAASLSAASRGLRSEAPTATIAARRASARYSSLTGGSLENADLLVGDVPPVADTANDAAAGEKGFASLDGAGWHDDDGA